MTDPIDDTQPHPTVPPAQPNVLSAPAAPAAATDEPAPSPSPSPSTAGTPPLQAAPPGPPSDWREPAWVPPRDRPRDRGPSLIAIVLGVIVLAVGIYYFVDQTLGIDLPSIRWGSLWPLILIVIGGLIVIRAMGRR